MTPISPPSLDHGPNRSSQHALPILPSTVWSVITSFLRRDIPFPAETVSKPDIHQQDLVNCMRVNSEMHRAAAVHLYSTIITDNLFLLLYGYDTYTPFTVDSLRRYPKSKLLSLTTSLNLINRIEMMNVRKYRRLNPPSKEANQTLDTGGLSQNQVDSAVYGIDECDMVNFVVERVDKPDCIKATVKGGNIFTQLNNLVIGGGQPDLIWCPKDPRRLHPSDALKVVRDNTTALLHDTSAGTLCRRVFHGPLGSDALTSSASGFGVVVNHLDCRDNALDIHLGSINRFILTPALTLGRGGSFDAYSKPIRRIFEAMSDIEVHVPDSDAHNAEKSQIDDLIARTTVKVYGCYHPGVGTHYRLNHGLPEDTTRRRGSIDRPLSRAEQEEAERMVCEKWSSVMEERIGKKWAGRVKFGLLKDAPGCHGCGWKYASFMENLAMAL